MQIESIMFDWRLYAERGLPSYLHHHEDGKRVDVCEIQFLNKVILGIRLAIGLLAARPLIIRLHA